MYKEFWQYLKKVCCIEDLAILAYSCIYDEFDSSKEHGYYPNNHRDIEECVSIYYEEQFLTRIDALNKLKENLLRVSKERKFVFGDLYCIIKTIDNNFQYTGNHINMGFSNFFTYKSLSLLSDSPTIFLLPKFNKSFIDIFNDSLIKIEKKNNPKKSGLREKSVFDHNNINAYLRNILLIHKQEIEEKDIYIHELLCKNKDLNFSQNILANGSFKTLIVPVSKMDKSKIFNLGVDEKNFWINGITDEAEAMITQTYLSIIEKYINTDVNFIVFPEMFLTKSILKMVQNHLRNLYKGQMLQFFVLGSMWTDFSNTTVIIASDGEIIFKQSKKIPFKYNGLYEKLLNKDNEIHFIDFWEFARVSIFICKEISDDKLMTIPKIMGSNLMIAPSFSASLDMQGIPKQIATNYHCTTIMCNACSPRYGENAVTNKKPIGFICQPSKKGTESSCKTTNYKFQKKCDNCENICDGYILNICFDTISNSNNRTFKTTINDAQSNGTVDFLSEI